MGKSTSKTGGKPTIRKTLIMPKQSNYDIFIHIIHQMYLGCDFQYDRRTISLNPQIFSPYFILREIKTPITPLEKYVKHLPSDFLANARSEMYRKEGGWINRGVNEGIIIRFIEEGETKLIPVLQSGISVGIDSSRNLFAVCCLDNVLTGIRYVEKYLKIRRDIRKNEFNWHSLNPIDKTYLITKINTLLNISCKAVFIINTNLINSTNRLTRSQFRGLIQGSFTGYETNPTQNAEFRQNLRRYLFSLCNNISTHCDPDFGRLRPPAIVDLLVRELSRIGGKTQPCIPTCATVASHESSSIQLADLIAGAFSTQIDVLNKIPPYPTKHLLFNDKWISKTDTRKKRWAKAYYWLREGG